MSSSLNNPICAVSIDIGIRNLAFYVERIDVSALKGLSTTAKKRFDEAPDDLIGSVYLTGKRIEFELIELGDKNEKFSVSVFQKLGVFLSSRKEIWDRCSLFLIEKQLYKANPKAEKISQFCFSFFMQRYPFTKMITFFPSKYKTKWLIPAGSGAEKMKKSQRKKWAVDQTFEIFFLRKDMSGIEDLLRYDKKDDLSDCVCQLQAFKLLVILNKRHLFI